MKLTKEEAINWRYNTINLIRRLNTAVGNELTGENFYDLQFRGKSHSPILLCDNMIIARGIININNVLYDTLKYYNLI